MDFNTAGNYRTDSPGDCGPILIGFTYDIVVPQGFMKYLREEKLWDIHLSEYWIFDSDF